PTASPVPDGFIDCSQQFGGQSFCIDPTVPECWGELRNYADSMYVVEMQDCAENHGAQTYAAGVLSSPVNRQSQLEAKKEVKALCTKENLDKVLASRKRLKDWQINAIPPQILIESDDFFRCLFTIPGGQTGPVKLKVPK
ncbi:MAG: hypothetical protein ABWX96_11620, partial [Propionibacteriaceae bacterium]